MNEIITTSLLICIFSILILLLFIFNLYNKNKKIIQYNKNLESAGKEELKSYFTEEWNHKEQELLLKQKNLESELSLRTSDLNGRLDKLNATLKEKEKRYDEVNQDLDRYRIDRMNEIDGSAAEYERQKRIIISQSIDKYRDKLIDQANESMEVTTEAIEEVKNQLTEVKAELEEERSKRAAINEEIRKNEEKEKYIEIHSVQLTDNEKEDIHFLLSLEEHLHNKQALYKLVWSTYLQQAYKNTFNNILGNRNPRNVIYCIENINTGKKYIGKTSAEISKRWTEHIKTSLNIGTIKTTNIHKALYNHWDEFIFYILAETEKDKLSEMEKYYISFYESDKYGYNIKAGG